MLLDQLVRLVLLVQLLDLQDLRGLRARLVLLGQLVQQVQLALLVPPDQQVLREFKDQLDLQVQLVQQV